MVGVVLPKISPEVGELTGEYVASGPAADVLETLRVDDHQSGDGYDRDLFGYRETDDDGDGCDVRDEVLARDLEDVTFTTPGGCQVQSGVLHDLYTGKTIDFMRGPQTSGAGSSTCGGVGERLAVGRARLGYRQAVQVRQRHVQPTGRRRRGEQ